MGTRKELAIAVLTSLLLVGANAAFVSSTLGFVHRPKSCLETDHYRYIDMSLAPPGRATTDRAREAPFCYRILVPGIVHGLHLAGLTTNVAFYLTSNVFLVLFLVTFHALLRARGASRPEALLGLALVALVPGAVRWYEYQYWMPDPAGLFLTTLALLLIRLGRERPLLVLSPVAVLARETYMLALPYAFLHVWRKQSLRAGVGAALRLAAVTLPVLVLLRLSIASSGGPGLVAAAQEMLPFRARHLWDNQIYFATLGSFGVLLPLALLRPLRLVEFARRSPEDVALVVLAYASLAFANNTDRLLAYALPALVPAALRNARALRAAASGAFGAIAAAAVALQGLFYWTTPFHERGISIYQPTNVPVSVAMAVFWLASVWWMWRATRGAGSASAADAHLQTVDPLARRDEQ
jgi:hypothetical protein